MYAFVLSISLILLVPSDYLFAQEEVPTSGLPETNDDQAEPSADTPPTGSVVQDVLADSVRSMFQEKESPLLHIRWGTKLYVDLPIGNEPIGASPTLRKAELKLSRAFGKNVQIKLSGTYLTDKDIIGGREGNLSLGLNRYLNEKLRVMANVIKVVGVDRPGSEYDGLSPVIFALRTQWLIYK